MADCEGGVYGMLDEDVPHDDSISLMWCGGAGALVPPCEIEGGAYTTYTGNRMHGCTHVIGMK